MARESILPADIERELIADIASFQHDPEGFVWYVYPWGREGTSLANKAGPRAWQRDVLRSIGERLRANTTADVWEVIQEAVASGHGIGKSALVAWLIHWAMSTHEDTRGVVTANTDTQLRTKTWPEVSKWYHLAINRHWFHLTATAIYSADPDHEKTWRVDILPWSEHNTEAFAGLHNEGKRILLIFDEASAIADKIWEVAEGALTDEHTEIIWCAFGNPTRNTGRFRECFRRYRHRWKSRHIDSRTVDGTNKGQLDKWVQDYGEDSDFVRVRVRGQFPAQSIKQFISGDLVDAARGRHLRAEQYNFAPVIITCDPAWEGDDELVIAKRQGLMFDILEVIPKNDNDVLIANKIARHEIEHRADAVFVDGGYGTGIISAGRTMGRTWQIVWFSDKAADPGYINKRAEMWGSVKQWLADGGAIPDDDDLAQDLIGPETVARLDGKIQLESKKDMKERGLPSPNKADALALSFAAPVTKEHGRPGETLEAGRAITDYDPFSRA